jgi:hypothetical protein
MLDNYLADGHEASGYFDDNRGLASRMLGYGPFSWLPWYSRHVVQPLGERVASSKFFNYVDSFVNNRPLKPSAITTSDGFNKTVDMSGRRSGRGRGMTGRPGGYTGFNRYFENNRPVPWRGLPPRARTAWIDRYNRPKGGRGRMDFRGYYGPHGAAARRNTTGPGTRSNVRIPPTQRGRTMFRNAPTNFGSRVKGNSKVKMINVRGRRGGDYSILKQRIFVGAIVFKATTGATNWVMTGGSDNGGQWYIKGDSVYMNGNSIATICGLYEHYRMVKCCAEFITRLATTDTTCLVWGTSDDPLVFKRINTTNATTNLAKTDLLKLQKSGCFNAWTPRTCIDLKMVRKWLFTASQDLNNQVFNYSDSAATQRDAYAGVLGVMVEGTTPGSDTTVCNVFMDVIMHVKGIDVVTAATLSSTSSSSVGSMTEDDMCAMVERALALGETGHFDTKRFVSDFKKKRPVASARSLSLEVEHPRVDELEDLVFDEAKRRENEVLEAERRRLSTGVSAFSLFTRDSNKKSSSNKSTRSDN